MSEEDTNTLALSDSEFEKLPVPVESEPEEEAVEAQEGTLEAQEDTQTEKAEESALEEKEPVERAKNGLQEESETSEEVESEPIDYKALYKEVFKPFKANGKEMKVDSIEDVRQLMQMGANYNKKMAGLKPNLKLLKMLENNGLLDEEKVSYLIDLNKRDPEAIKKLLKESEIDPLDVDIHSEANYEPKKHVISDKELELDNVLAEIKETESFNTTINILGNQWDEKSKKVLVENPNIIKIINAHVGNGIYNTIMNEVERLKVLGKLEGLSDIEAYKAVGDAMYASKGNNIKATTSKATNSSDPQLKDRKKAASQTKGVSSNAKSNFNPLAMSDDEFEKIAKSKYI